MTAERGSRRSARSEEQPPGAILSTAGSRSPKKKGSRREQAARVARPTDPTPAAVTKPLPSFRPKRPQARKPASGSAGTSQSGRVTAGSPFQEIDLVHVDRLLVPEEGDEDREPDGGLSRGDRDDEEDQDLSLPRPERRAVTEERQVGRVHHHLDREEDRDRAAPEKRPGEPD